MYEFIRKPLIVFVLFFSSNLFAHPHHSEANAIAHHGAMQVINDNALFIILMVVIGLLVYHFSQNSNDTQSKDK